MSCRRHRRLLHLLLLLLLVPGARQPFAGTRAVRAPDASPLYTNTWAVRVPGGAEHARSIARRHGFINFGRVMVPFSPVGCAPKSGYS